MAIIKPQYWGSGHSPHLHGNVIISATKKQFDKAGDVMKLPYFKTLDDYFDDMEKQEDEEDNEQTKCDRCGKFYDDENIIGLCDDEDYVEDAICEDCWE